MDLPRTKSLIKKYEDRLKKLNEENQEIFIREVFETKRSISSLRAWMMFFVVFGVATITVTSLSNYNKYSAQIGLAYSAFLIILILLENYANKKYWRNEVGSLMDFLEWKNKKGKR